MQQKDPDNYHRTVVPELELFIRGQLVCNNESEIVEDSPVIRRYMKTADSFKIELENLKKWRPQTALYCEGERMHHDV
jgi:hypothetical protein